MKALKAFIKPFEAPQIRKKIFILTNTTFWNARVGRVNFFTWTQSTIWKTNKLTRKIPEKTHHNLINQQVKT